MIMDDIERLFNVKIDRARLQTLDPVEQSIQRLNLPMLRFRKVNTILNALKMQIEDGGDDPAVNAYLVKALRAAIITQVGETSGKSAIEALDRFERAEQDRSQKVKNPPKVLPEDLVRSLNLSIETGYLAMETYNSLAACKLWWEGWTIVKRLTQPNIKTRADFMRVYQKVNPQFSNWCYDLMFELHNAGLSETSYQGRRIEYIQEFLNLFLGEKNDDDVVLNFGRGKAEALWRLGRIPESEAAYANLVARLPDAGWAYIGWADEYWIFKDSSKDYARGEAILRQALQRPNLQDRPDVLERLKDLYLEWGKNVEAESTARQLISLSSKPAKSSHRHKKKKH
jgi:tetratricopeptide (TPR) repeat protein